MAMFLVVLVSLVSLSHGFKCPFIFGNTVCRSSCLVMGQGTGFCDQEGECVCKAHLLTCTDGAATTATCQCGSSICGKGYTCTEGTSNCKQYWREECSEPCSGEQCEPVSEMIKFLIDASVDPCDDFFAFACSEKTRGNKLPIPRRKNVDFKELVKFPPTGFEYIEKFYRSCSKIDTAYTTAEVFQRCFKDGKCDEEEIRTYGDIFAQFLQFTREFVNKTMLPAVTPQWEEVTKDLYGGQGWNWWDFAASNLKDYFFLEAFHRVETDKEQQTAKDMFRSNVFFAPMIDTFVELGSLEILPKIHIIPISIHETLRIGEASYIKRYKALMKMFFTDFGGNSNSSTIDEDVEKIVNMELQVGKINSKEWFSAEPGSGEEITIGELHELVPSVEWKDYIEAAFSHNSNFTLKRNHKLVIPSQSLMIEMGQFIENLSRRDQANLLIWRMFIKFANDFMHTGTNEGDLENNLFGEISKSSSRPDNCIAQIKSFFPHAHMDMYISKYLDESTRNTIKEMFKELAEDFEKIIEDSDWISRTTQLRAKEKLKAMEIIVGDLSPNTFEFKELKDRISSDDYFGNILAIGNYKWIKQSKDIEKEKKLVTLPADTNNAYYFPLNNHVEILIGLINDLYVSEGLSSNMPRALVYGGFVSSTLGHEMFHGFDDSGRMYDKDGFLLHWWKPSEDKTFEERTECLMKRYANFTISYDGEDYRIPGTKYEAGENIADNGGVKAAYRSYQRLPDQEKKCISDPNLSFTSDQLFWLGHAFSWCITGGGHEEASSYTSLLMEEPSYHGHYPAPWRVNTVLSNQPEFAAAFKCPEGSRLNPSPQDRCSVW